MRSRTVMAALILASAAANGQTVPYVWKNVTIVAGGFVPGIEFSPAEKNLFYCRTDIGGAYRWDANSEKWIPLTDWADRVSWNRLGIESIAPDPTDPKRVYAASGTYTQDFAGNGVVLRSTDRGNSWQQTPMPFKMGGNEDGRSIGERLAIDPNQNGTLYLGSRHNGLWISNDFGKTWKPSATFPFHGERQGYGVGFIVFDPRSGTHGQPTPVIYVGVEDGDSHLYRSDDAGKTWEAVTGQPTGLMPHHAVLTPQGILYSTWCDGPGPNGVSNGAVFRYDTTKQTWTDISPIHPNHGGEATFGFAGLSVDAQHPDTIMVATLDRWSPGDDIFRSTDGGQHWKSLKQFSARDISLAPYMDWGKPYVPVGHWMGALQIDPFDSNHVLYGTGATIFGCDDVTQMDRNQTTHWNIAADGIEETAVLDLISPPRGPHLLSALGDLGGFRHDDLNVSPKSGMFKNPLNSSCNSLDEAANDPDLIVRVGEGNVPHGAYSTDLGKTWQPFASEPPRAYAGYVAISADGKTIVWSSRRGGAFYSTDRGHSWNGSIGVNSPVDVISDRVDPQLFYAIDEHGGSFYVSDNGGKNFVATRRDLPEPGRHMRAWPGRQGVLLLPLHSSGLMESDDAGRTLKKVDSVQAADAIGFGKSAKGEHELTVYLAGKIAGTNGIFRSTDSMKTWQRINDDAHQYGAIDVITGDPRIFGRVYLGTNGRGIPYADEKN
ncbi:MAG TPA: xyloglucanase [Tepidisphaeraceae bacterium]